MGKLDQSIDDGEEGELRRFVVAGPGQVLICSLDLVSQQRYKSNFSRQSPPAPLEGKEQQPRPTMMSEDAPKN